LSKCINITFAKTILHKLILVTHNFKIEDRHRKVATLLAQSMTEIEIAHELKVDQSTVSRDIKALKALSQRFVFDLAKSDLAYYYKQCIDGIEEVRRKGWEIFKGHNNINLTPKDKLLALSFGGMQ
jgi:Trp operon repressor